MDVRKISEKPPEKPLEFDDIRPGDVFRIKPNGIFYLKVCTRAVALSGSEITEKAYFTDHELTLVNGYFGYYEAGE